MGKLRFVLPLALAAPLALASIVAADPGTSPMAALPPAFACGQGARPATHLLGADGPSTIALPCAHDGAKDFAGELRVATTPEGVSLAIRADDDKVALDEPDASIDRRDTVLVFAGGRSGKPGVAMPLEPSGKGWSGHATIGWDALPTLTDEGTPIELSIFDADGPPFKTSSEELRASLRITAGKSCERARDENVERAEIGKRAERDLSPEELGAPMRTTDFFTDCQLADSDHATICVAVREGKPVGVSVTVTPENRRVAACIDRAARKLRFPESEKLDVVKQTY